jgi:hypothetical protein
VTRVRLLLLAAALVVTGSACSQTLKQSARPDCVEGLGTLSLEELGFDGRKVSTLTLFAQAVPTADRVPCVQNYPAGWRFSSMRVRNGQARFSLDNDRVGVSVAKVTLTKSCDVEGAQRIASSEPGVERFERTSESGAELAGTRYYLFPGGCVTHEFRFPERGSQLVAELDRALHFATRVDLNRQIRRTSGQSEYLL